MPRSISHGKRLYMVLVQTLWWISWCCNYAEVYGSALGLDPIRMKHVEMWPVLGNNVQNFSLSTDLLHRLDFR